MRFTAASEHYDRFMGRYTAHLAPVFVEASGIAAGTRVADVGCGPGGLTSELVARCGAERVAAIDPAPQFATACAERNPGADVREGVAEDLPWEDDAFDAALACLVVAFMSDAVQGLREMARVTRPGGTVAACIWDTQGGGMQMLDAFWDAARAVDPSVQGERHLAGTGRGDLGELFTAAGLRDVADGELRVQAAYRDFDDFWEPFTLGVGPAGQHLASLAPADRDRVRDECRARVPGGGSFELEARAWFARGTA